MTEQGGNGRLGRRSERGWGADTDLLEALRDGLQTAAPEQPATEAGHDVWVLREVAVDLAMAELLYDSAAGMETGVRRDGDEEQTLSFGGPGELGLDLHLSATRLVGQLLPPGPGEVVITAGSGKTSTVQADDLGCFEASRPHGLYRVMVRCVAAAGPVTGLTTPWLRG